MSRTTKDRSRQLTKCKCSYCVRSKYHKHAKRMKPPYIGAPQTPVGRLPTDFIVFQKEALADEQNY